MRTFAVIWLGQTMSLVGSGVTVFGISIWVYQETGSVTLFAINAFLNFLPRSLLSPLAGLIADRRQRRTIMIVADCGAAASTLLLAALFFSGSLTIWHVYLVTAANALFSTFQAPAYAAAVTAMTPTEQHTRASAMLQLSGHVSLLLAPTIAGFLLLQTGLVGIMFIDFISFLVAVGILFACRFPEPIAQHSPADQTGLWKTTFEGWRYVGRQPALRCLLILSGFNLFFIAVNATLSIPILLTVTTVEIVGLMAMFFGIGGLLGSAVMIVGAGRHQPLRFLLVAHTLIGLGLILFGVRPSLLLLTSAGFGLAVVLPVRDTLTEAIWRAQIPLGLQGRVFALLQFISSFSFGLAYILVGPLADRVFEPWLSSNGLLADSVGRVIGTGAGRGMAFCVVLAGVFTLIATGLALANARFRSLTVDLSEDQASASL